MSEVISDPLRAYVHCRKHFGVHPTETMKGICLVKDGATLAASLYDEYNGSNIWMHCAGTPGKPWLNRDFLYWSFHYPFVQLGVRRISLWIESTNQPSRRFAEHLGFKHEATLAEAGRDGVDACIYSMFRNDCRYVADKYKPSTA